MNSNPFKIDFRKWVLMLIPTMLRKPVLYHFVYVATLPIVSVYRSFAARRMNNNLFARYDSSNGNIQRMLNILFPSEVGSVIVRPSTTAEVQDKRVYLTTSIPSEYTPAIVGESYIDKELAQNLFEVVLPSDLKNDETKKQISVIVSRYALPGYTFNID